MAASRMPLVDVDVRVIKPGKPGGEEDGVIEVKMRRIFKNQNNESQRSGGGKSTAPRAVCPLYPKVKEEGWWLVLGDRNSRELLALRRVSFGNTSFAKLTYAPPEGHHDRPDLVVYLVSDCYIGLDQEVEFARWEHSDHDPYFGGGDGDEARAMMVASGSGSGSGSSRIPAPRGKAGNKPVGKKGKANVEEEEKSSSDDDFWLDPGPGEQAATGATAAMERRKSPARR